MSCIANEEGGPTPDTTPCPLAGFSAYSLRVSRICPAVTVPQALQTISPESRSVTNLSPSSHTLHRKFFNFINYDILITTITSCNLIKVGYQLTLISSWSINIISTTTYIRIIFYLTMVILVDVLCFRIVVFHIFYYVTLV